MWLSCTWFSGWQCSVPITKRLLNAGLLCRAGAHTTRITPPEWLQTWVALRVNESRWASQLAYRSSDPSGFLWGPEDNPLPCRPSQMLYGENLWFLVFFGGLDKNSFCSPAKVGRAAKMLCSAGWVHMGGLGLIPGPT